MSEPNPKRNVWDVEWILSVLPHRYPLLLVDRVLEMEPKKRIVALKNVTINEQFFQGHFPGQPVMPGVLLIEGLAQAGGLLLLHEIPDREKKLILFMGIEEAKFRRPVEPGVLLTLEVSFVQKRAKICKFAGRALVDGDLCTEASFTAMIADPPAS